MKRGVPTAATNKVRGELTHNFGKLRGEFKMFVVSLVDFIMI